MLRTASFGKRGALACVHVAFKGLSSLSFIWKGETLRLAIAIGDRATGPCIHRKIAAVDQCTSMCKAVLVNGQSARLGVRRVLGG